LNKLERRLSAWQPAVAGLDGDAMLFAAGRASVRPGPARFIWPALTACMTGLAACLGIWLAAERSERLDLARQLRQSSPALATRPSPAVVSEESPAAEELPPDSYLASHRALEKGLDAWPPRTMVRADPPGPPPHPLIFQMGQRNALLDP
jgi:hypothetical protein